MSSGLIIATVTALLRRVLQVGVVDSGLTDSIGDVTVSALPPDRIAAGADERPQLNLFLHQITPNTSMRNNRLARSEGNKASPFAFDLHYLVTAYGEKELQIESLLGNAIQFFAATSPMRQADIMRLLRLVKDEGGDNSAALRAPGISDLMAQIGQLAITPQFLGSEEASRLWSALQARYRPSIGYKVSFTSLDGAEQ